MTNWKLKGMRHCCLIHLPYSLTDVMFVCELDVDAILGNIASTSGSQTNITSVRNLLVNLNDKLTASYQTNNPLKRLCQTLQKEL